VQDSRPGPPSSTARCRAPG